MPNNLAAGTFRIVSRTDGEGSHLAGLGGPFPQGMDSQPIVANLDPEDQTIVWQFPLSIQNARLTSSAVVGSSQGGCPSQ